MLFAPCTLFLRRVNFQFCREAKETRVADILIVTIRIRKTDRADAHRGKDESVAFFLAGTELVGTNLREFPAVATR